MSLKSGISMSVLLLVGLAAPFSAIGGDSSPAYFQARNLSWISPPMLAAGAATLTRTQQGISFGVSASGLMPLNAYTIWIVIYHRPENCAAGPGACAPPDLANPAVEGSTVRGAGAIAGLGGQANFYGTLREGDPPGGIEVNSAGGTVNGLKDSRKAEIHLAVRAHGPVVAGDAVNQLTKFVCPACVSVQVAQFEAVK